MSVVTFVAAVGFVPVDGSKVKSTLGVVTLTTLCVITVLFDVQYRVQGVAICAFKPFTSGNKVVTVKGNVGSLNVPIGKGVDIPEPAVESDVTIVEPVAF
jgi:microcompartment protein CcmL/EutN